MSSSIEKRGGMKVGEKLKGRNAVVTGAGRGIGRAVALALAEERANIVVCDLGCSVDGIGADRAPADTVVEECQKLGVRAVPCYGDVADFKVAEDMIKTCVDNFGRIDILCNIAGIFAVKLIGDMSEEEWDRVIAVHLKGTFNLTRHAIPQMRQQKYGRIVNCFSEAFAVPPSRGSFVGMASYSAAKGGIFSLTYATAQEVAEYGITCNAFAPRATTRGTQTWAIQSVREGFLTKEVASKAMEGEIKQDDASYFAPFVAYLASDAAAGINGRMFLTAADTLGVWGNPGIIRHVRRDWEREGRWSFEEIEKLVPAELLVS